LERRGEIRQGFDRMGASAFRERGIGESGAGELFVEVDSAAWAWWLREGWGW
jgi:hypothetical protein